MNENLVATKTAIVALFGALCTFLGWRMIMLLVWVMLMCLDYISGTLAARQNGTWKSEKAREGIGHKAGMMFVVIVSMIADFVIMTICDNLPHDAIRFDWPMAIFPMVTMWYILTEIGSIIENAIGMGANVPAWLPKILNATIHAVENVGEAVVDDKVSDIVKDTVAAIVSKDAHEEKK